MCESCPCSIPGPGEVAGGALEAAVGAALTKNGRRVMFWGVCIPVLPFAVWGVFGWWTIALAALAAAVAAGTFAATHVLGGRVVQARPELTHEMRAALAARGLKPIPAPGRQARPALPRGLSITRKRRALPAPAKALPAAVITGTVVPAPAREVLKGRR